MMTPEDAVRFCLIGLEWDCDDAIISTIIPKLPKEVVHLAKRWGWGDTEVTESIFQFLKQGYDE